jgi:hypothetical protein
MSWLKLIVYILTSKPCPCCSDDPQRCGVCPVCGGEGVVPGRWVEPREVF